MPVGTAHGWGIAGSYLRGELAKLPALDGVTLHSIRHDFSPFDQAAWDRINIGYCFFEHELLAAPFIAEAAERWDHVVAGSSWCEQQLRCFGMPHTSTILQGIDAKRFKVQPPRSDDGRFIVFSGGKFEFRKGQDIVLAAMRIVMQHHPDVWLSCAWYNAWPHSLMTMQQSRLIDFAWRDLPCQQLLHEVVVRAGLDPGRVLLHPPFDNLRMPLIYAESDLGLFPNRCEGGNNMVMCEYMACGRTVIASDRTGQADVITGRNAWAIPNYRAVTALLDGQPTGNWQEACLDEVVALLEEAYADRSTLHAKAQVAADDMRRLDWADAARQFHRLGRSLLEQHRQVDLGGPQAVLTFEQQLSVAEKLFADANYQQAAVVYHDLLANHPLHPGLHNSLGTVLVRIDRQQEAAMHYLKALGLAPDFTEARFNLGNSLASQGDLVGAQEQLSQVVQERPGWSEAWEALACCREETGDLPGAISAWERVADLKSDDGQALQQLGRLQAELRCYDLALVSFTRAAGLLPRDSSLLNARGLVLHELGRLDEAADCFCTVLVHDRYHAIALNNLGNVHKSALRLEEALDCYDQALVHDPENATIVFNRALLLLLQGDLLNGWPGFERRFEMVPPVVLSHPELPRWQGEALAGRTLLVQAEQVYGDTLMFVRFLPLLARLDGPVLFECQDQIVRPVLQMLEQQGVKVVVRGELLPRVDLQVPLLSLPGIFGTTLAMVPFAGGYLQSESACVGQWSTVVTAPPGVLKVGLVWGGRKAPLNADRSLVFNELASLLELDGVRYFSLQIGEDAGQLQGYSDRVEPLGHRIRHFGDTAAILQHLDLLITIDTAVAHLAGAMGRPVWVLLKYSPDWRWLLERTDSPWYRSARLFRQAAAGGGWSQVVRDVRQELSGLLTETKKTAKVTTGD